MLEQRQKEKNNMLQWMHYLYFICLIELMAIQSRDKVVLLEQSTENVKLKPVVYSE